MPKIIGCTIESDYKPCIGCPFEDRQEDCRYYRNQFNAGVKME